MEDYACASTCVHVEATWYLRSCYPPSFFGCRVSLLLSSLPPSVSSLPPLVLSGAAVISAHHYAWLAVLLLFVDLSCEA